MLDKSVVLDLFYCGSTFTDMATISIIINKTGGKIYSYPSFSSVNDGERLH